MEQNYFSYYQTAFDADEFRARRACIFEAIGSNAVAVLQGAGPMAGYQTFRQANAFFYLTGLEVPQAYLVMDGRTGRTTLCLPHRDAHLASIEGREPAAEDREALCALTGCDDVRGPESLMGLIQSARTLFTPLAPAEGPLACQDTLRHQARLVASDAWDGMPSREAWFRRLLAERVPAAEIRDLSPTIFALRVIKSPAELAVMRRAGAITARALVEAVKTTRPGMFEYQLGAVADRIYIDSGARGAGYRPIIAAGRNIWMMHYYRNNARLQAGDLVLFDYAPDLFNYTSDIGRMWPVDGVYSPVQRELYGFVVAYHRAMLSVLRPGVPIAQLMAAAAAAVDPYIRDNPFTKPIYEQGARTLMASPNKVFTHPVGMAVHDGCSYTDLNAPLSAGYVFALDPQLWVPEEELYIRVEDTVAITADGVESLTADAPLGLDELAALVGRE